MKAAHFGDNHEVLEVLGSSQSFVAYFQMPYLEYRLAKGQKLCIEVTAPQDGYGGTRSAGKG